MNGVMTLKWKHLIAWISIMLVTVLFCGCSLMDATTQEVTDMISEEVENTETDNEAAKEIETKMNNDTDKNKNEFVKFFKQFYGINESDILALNTYPTVPNEDYKETYKSYVDNSLELLKNYMTPSLEEKIQKKFFNTDVHFPRFIYINGNVITRFNNVEDVECTLVKEEEDKSTYTIDVTVKADVISNNRFNELYTFNNEVNYYELRNADNTIEDEDKDEIKVQCSYVAEIQEKNNKILFYTLKENGEDLTSEESRRNILSNDYVKRVNYFEEALASDSLLIKDFFNIFLNQDKDAYKYYENSFDTNFDLYEQMLIDLGIDNYLLVFEDYFQSQFPKMIVPTKDDVVSVSTNKKDINVTVHSNSTKKVRYYVVDVPTNVQLSDYTNKDVFYRYYVMVENNEELVAKISQIQYIYMKDAPTASDSIEETDKENEEGNEETEGSEDTEESVEDF